MLNCTSKKNNKIIYNLDSLIYFSALHFGDNDSTGIIAGVWFGALTGKEYIKNINMEKLEFYKELNQIANKIIKKFK